jgi:hypothetical protein
MWVVRVFKGRINISSFSAGFDSYHGFWVQMESGVLI